MAVYMKQAIPKNMDNHFSDVQQCDLMLCATCLGPCLGPCFKQLTFLPADERVDIYLKLCSIVTENHSSESESDN